MKRIFSIILSVALIIIALPTAIAAADSPMGRYVETSIPMPTDVKIDVVYSMELNADGNLELYCMIGDTFSVCTLNDDGTWSSEELAWSKYLTDVDTILTISCKHEGAWLVKYMEQPETGEYHSVIEHVTTNGLEQFNPAEDLSQPFFNVWALPNGNLALGGSGTELYVLDAQTGRTLYTIENDVADIYANESYIFALVGSSVIQCDIATGEHISEMTDAPVYGTGDSGANILANIGDTLYMANRAGVYRIADGGSIWEQIVDGNLTSMRMPTMDVHRMAILGDDVYILLSGSDECKLMRYSYDANVPTVPSNELNVYTLYNNSLLTQAATEFQLANPDYIVNITELLGDDTAATAADVIRSLNTEILAGNGPDVLLLDDMPLDSYIEKGVLLDISTMVNELIDSGELLPNLIEQFRSDGAIYSVPTAIDIPTLIGKPEYLAQVATLDALVQYVEANGAAMPVRTREGWFMQLISASYPAWFNGDGTLNEANLTEYLDYIARLGAACGTERDEHQDSIEEMMVNSNLSGSLLRSFTGNSMGGYGVRSFELYGMRTGDTHIAALPVMSFIGGMFEFTVLDEVGGTLASIPGQAGNAYMASGIVGVNAQSQHQEAAINLVRTMLSEATQGAVFSNGLPVNFKAFEAQVQAQDTAFTAAVSMSESSADGEEVELEPLIGKWPTSAIRERVLELETQLTTPYILNTELLGMIKTELKPFFEGTMEATQAAAAVSAKISAYIAE